MGKKSRRKKNRSRSQLKTFVATADAAMAKADESGVQQHRSVGLDLASDEPIIANTRGVGHEVRNIAILMTSLAAVVAVVAIINAQTPYVNNFGQALMKLLHIQGA
jgi:hypothetical protein